MAIETSGVGIVSLFDGIIDIAAGIFNMGTIVISDVRLVASLVSNFHFVIFS